MHIPASEYDHFPMNRGTAEQEPVRAIMVTGKDPRRLPLCRNSILSFLRQDYSNKHLVIVTDCELTVTIENFSTERLQLIRTHAGQTLGQLRNVGLEAVPESALFVQWDDDDWHAESLISEQREFMLAHKLHACSPREQIKFSLETNAAWTHRLPDGFFGFAGAIMARNDLSVRYPSKHLTEDSEYWAKYVKRHHCASLDNPRAKYIRMIHGSNTSPHLGGSCPPPDTWNLPNNDLQYLGQIATLYGVPANRIANVKTSTTEPVIAP